MHGHLNVKFVKVTLAHAWPQVDYSIWAFDCPCIYLREPNIAVYSSSNEHMLQKQQNVVF